MYKDLIAKKNKTKIKTAKEEIPVIPAEHHQPDIPKSFMKNDWRATTNPDLYSYVNINGQICFYVKRWYDNRGKKQFTPLALWKNDDDIFEWKQKAWPENRPLYRENELANPKRGNDPVLITEGEKACLAAVRDNFIKDKYICVSFSGGAKAAYNTNFKALKGREIVLMPDHDKPGTEVMHEIAYTLIQQGITDKIKWITYVGKKLPDKWDAADPLPQGHTMESIVGDQIDYEDTDYETYWKKIEKKQASRQLKEIIETLKLRYVWIEKLNMFWDQEMFTNVELRSIANRWLHVTKKSPITADKALLMEPDFPKVVSYVTHPGLASGVIELESNQILDLPKGKYLNNFRPHDLIADNVKQKDVKTIVSFYQWLLGVDNWTIVEQFIAMLVQAPGLKAHWVIFIQSVEGGGKGLIGLIIQAILGKNNAFINVKASQLIEKHSTLIQGRQLIILNELSFSNSTKEKAELTNELKDLFTEHELIINQKNKDPVRTGNFCNFLIYTNDPRALKLDKNARRYAIMRVEHDQDAIVKKQENLNIVDTILNLTQFYPGALLYYFKNTVKLNDKKYFTGHAPRTIDFDSMLEDTKDDIFQFLDDALEAGTWPFNHELIQDIHNPKSNGFSGLVNLDELLKKIQKETKYFVSRAKLSDWLKERAIRWKNGEWTKQILLSDQSRPKMWLLVNMKGGLNGEELIDMTDKDLGAHHEKYGYAKDSSAYFNTRDYLMEKSSKMSDYSIASDYNQQMTSIIREFKEKNIDITNEDAERIYAARKQERLLLEEIQKKEAIKALSEARK